MPNLEMAFSDWLSHFLLFFFSFFLISKESVIRNKSLLFKSTCISSVLVAVVDSGCVTCSTHARDL